MALDTTYRVLVDWNNNRLFDHAESDISGDLISIPRIQLGRNYNSQVYGRSIAGTMEVIVRNDDSKYSNLLVSSPLFGQILNHRRIRYQVDAGSGYVTNWEGWLDDVIPIVRRSGLHRARFKCRGPIIDFTAEKVYEPMQTSVLTGVAANKIMDAMGIPKLYATQVGDDSPVGYWRFGESSGNAIDVSGNGNDGTVTGVTQGAAALLGEDANTSYDYGGATGDVDMGSPAILDDVFAAGGAVDLWAIADSDGENDLGFLFEKTTYRCYISGESGGFAKLSFEHDFSSTNGIWITTAAVLTIGAVHHIMIDYNRDDVGNAPAIKIDGATVAVTESQTPIGSASTDAGGNLLIGNRVADDRTWDGHIQEFAIYDATQGATKARQHHIAGRQRYRDVDVGQTTMDRWWSPGSQLGQSAMRKVEETEFAFFRESLDGKTKFEDRNYRLTGARLISQATYRDTTADIPYAETSPTAPQKDIANRVRVPVNAYSANNIAVLWTLPETPSLSPGESITFRAEFPQDDSAANAIGVDPWTDPVSTDDYTGNTQAGGGGTDRTASLLVTGVPSATSYLVTITNQHASDTVFLTLMQVRGIAILKTTTTTVEVFDQDSIDVHGDRTYLVPAEFIQDSSDALDYGNFVLQLQKDQHIKTVVRFQANISDAALSDISVRDISDRVTYRADGAAGQGINEEMFVENISQSIDEGGIHDVTLVLSPAGPLSATMILDTGRLDTNILGR